MTNLSMLDKYSYLMMIIVANDTTTATSESAVHNVNSTTMSRSHWVNRVEHAILPSSKFDLTREHLWASKLRTWWLIAYSTAPTYPNCKILMIMVMLSLIEFKSFIDQRKYLFELINLKELREKWKQRDDFLFGMLIKPTDVGSTQTLCAK